MHTASHFKQLTHKSSQTSHIKLAQLEFNEIQESTQHNNMPSA